LNKTTTIRLQPLGAQLVVPRDTGLREPLASFGMEFPCGGEGRCGSCRIRVLEGNLALTPEDQSALTEEEMEAGWRLACRARVTRPVTLEVGQWVSPILSDFEEVGSSSHAGLGIAVDLGTTTVVAQLLDLGSGHVLGVRSGLNPQAAYGADVMRRVAFALRDNRLTTIIRSFVGNMVCELAENRLSELQQVVLVGNTVMHHLFARLSVEPLSHVPFRPTDPAERFFTPSDLGWSIASSTSVRFLRCLGGFVGSDILAGIVATGMYKADETVALMDLGTNGEIVLGNRDNLLCASTAAGPAFEGACIRMGMRAAAGAISQVSIQEGALICHVIGNTAPRGICGSGLVDAVAAGLESGVILPNGRLQNNGSKEYSVSPPVILTQSDIRELQLAKAALASGLRILLDIAGKTIADVEHLYLAGAFGNYIYIPSACRLGMLEVPSQKVTAAGNTALRGAKMALLAPGIDKKVSVTHVSLESLPSFQDTFVDCIGFPATGIQEEFHKRMRDNPRRLINIRPVSKGLHLRRV
jgi:uncharacterized 2Fe-2S/4Fe-4S cluster protein (DUF4445 family)